MKVFRDLQLAGSEIALKATVEAIEDSLVDGWRRSLESEARIRSTAIGDGAAYCFACDPNGTRAGARLFLAGGDDGSLSVTNIVPMGVGSLSIDQYNAILREFHDRFAAPAAARSGAVATMTPDEEGIEAWLGAESTGKLRAFSSSANRSTGSDHPFDRRRWFEFLRAAHEEGSPLDASTLSRWLVESEHWGERAAGELAIEYEFGRGLLAVVDPHRAVH